MCVMCCLVNVIQMKANLTIYLSKYSWSRVYSPGGVLIISSPTWTFFVASHTRKSRLNTQRYTAQYVWYFTTKLITYSLFLFLSFSCASHPTGAELRLIRCNSWWVIFPSIHPPSLFLPWRILQIPWKCSEASMETDARTSHQPSTIR